LRLLPFGTFKAFRASPPILIPIWTEILARLATIFRAGIRSIVRSVISVIWPIIKPLRAITTIIALFIGALTARLATLISTLAVIVAIGTEIAIVSIVTIPEAIALLLAVAPIGPVVTLLAIAIAILLAALTALRTIIAVFLPLMIRPWLLMLMLLRPWLLRRHTVSTSLARWRTHHGTRLRTTAEVVVAAAFAELFIAFIVGFKAISSHAARTLTLRLLLARRLELFAIGHDDAIVMFGVLEVVLRQHPVTGRLRIARQLQIFLRNMRWRAAHFHIGSIRFKAARQRVLALTHGVIMAAVAVATTAVIVVATATTAVLLMLTWPHWRVSSRRFSKFIGVSRLRLPDVLPDVSYRNRARHRSPTAMVTAPRM
jgi:hypothetical protein